MDNNINKQNGVPNPVNAVKDKKFGRILDKTVNIEPVLVGYALYASDVQEYVDNYIRSKQLDGFAAVRIFIKKPTSSKPELHARAYFKKDSQAINPNLSGDVPEYLLQRMDLENLRTSEEFRRTMQALVSTKRYIDVYNKDYYSITLDILKILGLMFAINPGVEEIIVDVDGSNDKNKPLILNIIKQYKPADRGNSRDIYSDMIRNEVLRRD
jgi:hypothetical protein